MIDASKQALLDHLIAEVNVRIASAEAAMAAAAESHDNETKSTAGDKYETGRAMMQIDFDRSQAQLKQAQNLHAELSQIDTQTVHPLAQKGSLVITTQGKYFLSIGIGKVMLGDQLYYALSIHSPIGSLLHHKRAGDIIHFQGRKIEILEIV